MPPPQSLLWVGDCRRRMAGPKASSHALCLHRTSPFPAAIRRRTAVAKVRNGSIAEVLETSSPESQTTRSDANVNSLAGTQTGFATGPISATPTDRSDVTGKPRGWPDAYCRPRIDVSGPQYESGLNAKFAGPRAPAVAGPMTFIARFKRFFRSWGPVATKPKVRFSRRRMMRAGLGQPRSPR